jgi:hypothetical protein
MGGGEGAGAGVEEEGSVATGAVEEEGAAGGRVVGSSGRGLLSCRLWRKGGN